VSPRRVHRRGQRDPATPGQAGLSKDDLP